MGTTRYSLEDLKALMQRLRDPETGCPWDIKQSCETIAPSTLEEAYEVVDAIESGNFTHLKEELGDLLFQVIFYSQIMAEESRFEFDDIVSDLVAKLIRRHPHVFPDGTLESRFTGARSEAEEAAIKLRWEALKREERAAKGQAGLLADVPVNLPSLTRAAKLQKRAASVGFDWPTIDGVVVKIQEELAEVQEALQAKDPLAVQEELGDLLFGVVNACRHAKVDAETALRGANHKFEQRFAYIEAQLKGRGISAEEADLELMDQLWDQAKIALSHK